MCVNMSLSEMKNKNNPEWLYELREVRSLWLKVCKAAISRQFVLVN